MEILNAKEVRKILRCSLPLVYKLADRGQLPCVKIPCSGNGTKQWYLIRFKKEDIYNFIEKHYTAT